VTAVKASKAVRQTIVAACLLAASQAGAQVRSPAATPKPEEIQARQAMAALEGVLENAVRDGAQMLDQRLQASSAANMVMLAGMTRARGFRLDGYGVVFDVEFPSMRRSMVWSMETLEKRAATGAPGGPGAAVPSIKPREIYLTEITNALVDAVVDHGAQVGVSAEEWLTIAARESVDRRFVPGDPADTAMTIVLRIKGGDLRALRDRTLARDECLKRVEIRHY
jgi:hypothetical protein